MNRLNKIILSCVLPFFFLLISVSYAEWSSTPSVACSTENVSLIDDFGGYTLAQIAGFYGSSDLTAFNNMVSSVSDAGYYFVYMPYGGYSSDLRTLVFSKDSSVDIGANLYGTNQFLMGAFLDTGAIVYRRDGTTNSAKRCIVSGSMFKTNGTNLTLETFEANTEVNKYYYGNFPYIKKLLYANALYSYTWDGTYFYELSDVDEPDTPSLPSNIEIAQAVQAFYNSDYYKNNKDFSDFFVLYNYDTQYFSFIGHNFGTNLGQVIVPPDYEYEGYSYKQDWWKFFLRNISSQLASNLWNKYYWLYSTNDFGNTFVNDGKGSMQSLINLHFSTKSIIVYSTTDYPVVKIETDENGVLTPVEGTIPGDQYTYDENLDPTTNEYNPLENFVPTNPSQSILGDVDFDEINKTFEENKGILNIENASWLFTANNQFVGYFIGFLSLLIVFLIISRILGG